MSRHNIQIKALLENKRLGKSRFNPEVSMKSLVDSPPMNRSLKRCESSSQFRKKQSSELLIMQQRFKKLQQNYRTVLDQTRVKGKLFAIQKEELEKYKIQNQKDKKQIQRLRSMLGFIKKQDKANQINSNTQLIFTYDKDISKLSYNSKNQKSTEIGINLTNDSLKIKEKKKSNMKQSRARTPCKMLSNKSEGTFFLRSPLKQSNIKSPLSKYKFVPTLAFN